jgi:hypothetical protein
MQKKIILKYSAIGQGYRKIKNKTLGEIIVHKDGLKNTGILRTYAYLNFPEELMDKEEVIISADF